MYTHTEHIVLKYRAMSKLDALVKINKKIIITYSPYLAHPDELFKDLNILPIHKLML